MDSDSSQYIILFGCLVLSAFFSCSETALTSLSKIRLRSMVDENKKNAKLLQSVLNNPNKLISAILSGNNLVNIGASSLATVIATRTFGSNGVGIATGVLTLLVLIFGEITPKTFARNNCEKVSTFVVKPIYFCMIVFTPIIVMLNIITGTIFKIIGSNEENNTVTETEFLSMVDVSHEEGVLQGEEHEMITNVVDFRNSDAEEIMVPRTDMISIPDTFTYKEVIDVFKAERFTRIPVYNETNDHIVGILSFKDVMMIDNINNFKISDYMKEPYFTYESKKCSSLFAEMKKNSISMAIVLDEYGGTAGIITLQDLIEEIVGDILDEIREDEEEIVNINKNEFIVEGIAKLDDVNEVLGTNFVNDDIESIGGYVIALVDRFPENGEIIEDSEAYFEILGIDKNRIEQIKITVRENEKEEEKES